MTQHILPPMDKLTARQEAFCRHLAEGQSQRTAYIGAGYSTGTGTTADENASRLLSKNAKIRKRLADLQAQQAKRLGITVEKLVLEAEEERAAAMAAGQYQAALNATIVKARLMGFIKHPRARDPAPAPNHGTGPVTVRELSVQEWQARFCPKTMASEKPK